MNREQLDALIAEWRQEELTEEDLNCYRVNYNPVGWSNSNVPLPPGATSAVARLCVEVENLQGKLRQTRADALREAAGIMRKTMGHLASPLAMYNHGVMDTLAECEKAIIAAIGQPPCAECEANLSDCSRGPEDKEDCLAEMSAGPQEDVCCEWEKYTRSSSGWLYTTSCGRILDPVSGATCICGKPIKVTHGDKV